MPTSPATVIVGNPVKASDFNTAKTAIDELNQLAVLSQGKNVLNGSFEFDNEVPGTPDSWDMSTTGAGTFTIDTTVVTDGASSLKMNANALGGSVTATSADFISVTGGEDTVYVSGSIRQTAAAEVSGNILFYDAAESLIATQPFMLETSLPGVDTWYPIRGHADAPSSARYFKVQIKGGDGTAISSIYWDGIETGITPFDWIWDLQTLGSGQGNGTWTYSVNAVGYPKEVVTRREISGGTQVLSPLGWNGLAFATNHARGNFDPAAATDRLTAEPTLDPIGRFQFVASSATSSSSTTYQLAYR